MSRDPLQVWIPRPSSGAAGLQGERHHGAHTESERCRVPPGSLPRGPGPKSSQSFEPKRSPKRRRLLPPAGTVPPGRGPKGRDLYRWRLLSRPDARTHTHTHTIECNRTQCKNQFHAHAIRLCKAHTLQYSRRSGGQGVGGRQWLRYCTGVNVNNKASSERASPETRTAALYKNALKTTRFS